MDIQRFDKLTRLMATGASRRAVVRAVAGGLLGLNRRDEARAEQVEIEVGPIALCLGDLSLEVCLGLPHVADARCEAGRCVIEQCESGWTDCDGQTASGCETPLGTADNCGACGDICDSGVCLDGDCQVRQPPCDDGIPCGDVCCRSSDCQTGLCVDGAACYGQPANDGEPCESDDPCAPHGVCSDGVCVGEQVVCLVCRRCQGGDCVADADQDGTPCGEGAFCRGGQCESVACEGGVLCYDVCCPPETIACTVGEGPNGPVTGCLCPEGTFWERETNACLPCPEACAGDEECCSGICCVGACCEERSEPSCPSGIACGGTCCPGGSTGGCECMDGACTCRCGEDDLDCGGTCIPKRWPNGGIGCCSDADCPDDPGLFCCLDEASCGHLHSCVITID